MNISHLSNLVGQKEVYSNGEARVTGAAKADQTTLQASETPSVVYHGPELSNIPDTGGFVITEVYATPVETVEAANARYSEIVLLMSKKLGSASAALKFSYDSAVSSLSPELQEKDWGFSISAGKLTVSAGSDDLSEREVTSIKDALSDAGVLYDAEAVSDMVIRALELDRGLAGVSNGIGRYDVSQENFGDVVDLRTYLQSHTPGGRYARNQVNPADVAGLFYTGGQAMMDQISATAEQSYTRPADFGRVYV